MKRERIMKKAPLFLIAGILVLCVGFFIVSCGTDPQLKVLDPDAGQYALDFSDCNGTLCRVLVIIEDVLATRSSVGDRPVTAEAWVKVKSASTTGAVLGRVGSEGGIAMIVNNNVPKFSIRVQAVPTSTDIIVSSGVSLIQNVWMHIAGVLSNTVHSHPATATCAAGVGTETPHLDIYVDGTHTGCESTSRQFADDSAEEPMAVGVHGESGVTIDTVTITTPFNGIIDEVRIWGTERTADEISSCMKQELNIGGGPCGRTNLNLVGYLPFNEGKGAITNDWSGLGSGVKEQLPLADWNEGWTTDTPF